MTSPDSRAGVIRQVAGLIPAARGGGCVRVGVDGVDGAGKSTFADELEGAVRELGRTTVRISVDDFHRPRALRYEKGRDSPEGFWLDAFDYPALRADVLDPLGPGGDRRFRTAVHDVATDRRLELPWRTAAPGTVVIVDGLFLHRDELRTAWEFSIYLTVPFEVSVARMAVRDGTEPDPDHPSVARYVGGQRLYFAACAPWRRASLVVDNSDLNRPQIVFPGRGE